MFALSTPELPRSTSAYDNILTSCDDEFDAFPSSSTSSRAFPDNETSRQEIASPIQIHVTRDSNQPNGMAFRLVGSRSRGIFVDFVHDTSPQADDLQAGDRLLKCNNISLQAVSVEQAATILRYWMSRGESITVLVDRRPNARNDMQLRRKNAKLSMCQHQLEQRQNGGTYPSHAKLKITSSKSAEVVRLLDTTRDTSSSFRVKTPQYVSFDDESTIPICPQCQSPTRLLHLHQFSHAFMNNAFRLLTLPRSSYSLL